MPKLKNISPLGELDVPLLDRILDAGEEFDVSAETAEKLLPQAENYQPVDDEAHAILDRLTGRNEPTEPAPEQSPEPAPEAPSGEPEPDADATDHASDGS